MATAVETSSQPRTPNPPANLPLASLLGAVYVLASLAIVFYAVPAVWAQVVGNRAKIFVDIDPLRYLVQAAVAAGLGWFGQTLAGANPPRGIRGGIFLMISAAVTIFFLARAVGMWTEATALEGVPAQVITAVVAAGLLVLAYRFFTSPRGERWMVGLEEQGWFHASSYKRALGLKVRRLTILGILLIGGSGVYSLTFQGVLPESWALRMPFTDEPLTVMPDARILVPLLLIALTIWVAWRAVNMPTFAEFLIATEAEMNKVSWTTRRRLAQDTAVVLITTFLMTLFLFVVDIFWGWLLSRQTVGVLPPRATDKGKAGQVQEAHW